MIRSLERVSYPRRILRNSAAEHEAHMVRVQNSQRRGQWVRLVRKIDELRFRARIAGREHTAAEERDIANCQSELVTLEKAMAAAGQPPR